MTTRTLCRRLLIGWFVTLLGLSGLGTHAAARTYQERGPDWAAVEDALGATGQMMDGDVFRISLPRTDLDVAVQGVPIKTSFALGSYAAFKQVGPTASDVMVMGDLVLLDAELSGVMSGLFAAGLEITAVHNHLNEMEPRVMYMHYMGRGNAVEMAEGIHAALSVSGTPLGQTSPGASPGGEVAAGTGGTPDAEATPMTELDVAALEAVLGYSGRVANGGIVGFSIGRAETITEGDVALLPSMGVATAINFQPIEGGQAAITGDFLMTAEEVNPVVRALRENGIEVHALHNHHLAEEPRFFYMHFFATGDPMTLAQGLRAALDQINSAQP